MEKEQAGDYFPGRRRIALFLDVNIFRKNQQSEVAKILEHIAPWGKVVIKNAYSQYAHIDQRIYEQLLRHKFQIKCQKKAQRISIYIVLELMETLLREQNIETFVVVSPENDYHQLISHIHKYRRTVIGITSRKRWTPTWIKNCDVSFLYEDLLGNKRESHKSTLLRSSAEEMRTLLRKYNLYPPDPQDRMKILKSLRKIDVDAFQNYRDLQNYVAQICQGQGISKRSVRNCLGVLAKANLIVEESDVPLSEKSLQNICSLEEMKEAITSISVEKLLSDQNVLLDPLTMSQAIWGDSSYVLQIEKILDLRFEEIGCA